ncbi:MAG TPA: GTPase ObgE [Acidimicrobiales bacterium]
MAEGFVDEAFVNLKGGDGGAGAVSFRRESHVPKGGPDGGNGGKGGDVWLVANNQVASLLAFQDHPHRRAENGGHGQGKAKHGASGADMRVAVPVGTMALDRDGELLADLAAPGDAWLAAEGGRGGRGNASFLSNRRRAPTFAEQGEVGEERWIRLELKLMADVALVGFPNAGKSTLISRISAAKPKVADYPFTTLRPHLGVVRTDETGLRGLNAAVEFVVADIPGLVEGASEGRGLGHQFLRHVERARALAVLIDLGPLAGRPPDEQERVLLEELGNYRPELLDRPRLLVGTKADVAEHPWPADRLRISAVTGEGMKELVGRMADLVAEARSAEPAVGGGRFVVHRPVPEGVRVERDETGTLIVRGREAERAVAINDLTNAQALEYVQARLKRLGVDRALARAGARDGDLVRIGSFSFEYEKDA